MNPSFCTMKNWLVSVSQRLSLQVGLSGAGALAALASGVTWLNPVHSMHHRRRPRHQRHCWHRCQTKACLASHPIGMDQCQHYKATSDLPLPIAGLHMERVCRSHGLHKLDCPQAPLAAARQCSCALVSYPRQGAVLFGPAACVAYCTAMVHHRTNQSNVSTRLLFLPVSWGRVAAAFPLYNP